MTTKKEMFNLLKIPTQSMPCIYVLLSLRFLKCAFAGSLLWHILLRKHLLRWSWSVFGSVSFLFSVLCAVASSACVCSINSMPKQYKYALITQTSRSSINVGPNESRSNALNEPIGATLNCIFLYVTVNCNRIKIYCEWMCAGERDEWTGDRENSI